MTKSEAIKLESECENILSDATGEDCEVSMSLMGNLRIQFCDNNVSISKEDLDTPEWISFEGDYDILQNFIINVRVAIRNNKYLFEKLMWSYWNIGELNESWNA